MQNGGHTGEDATLGIRRKAVVIGVSEYANNLQALDFCQKDGEEVHRVLKSIGYEVPDSHKLVGQVKYETMKDAIYDFFTDPNVKAEDVLVFYYSGHGVPDVNGDVFLASSETNPDAPFRKGFSFHELTNTIERSNSTRIVTILDCCYSGAAKVSKGHEEDAAKLGTVAIDDKSRKLVQQGEGKCLLAASMGFQEAYGLKEKGHSIFTYYLLEGFRGAKSAVDEEGNVTPDTLGKYVFREIVNLPEGKRPKQKPIRKVEAGGDIILAQYPEIVKKIQDQGQNPYELIQDAIEYLKKGDPASAIEYSDKAIVINPAIASAYNFKGQGLFSLKKYDEALASYEKALELKPRYLEAINNMALGLATIGKHERAVEFFNKSTDFNPKDASIWNNKGLTFSTLGKYDEAIECFGKAIKLNPDYTEALKNEHIALSKLREQRDQQKLQPPEYKDKQDQPIQTGGTVTGDIGKPISTTKDTLSRVAITSEDVSSLAKTHLIKDKTAEELSKPPETKQASTSPIFSSVSKHTQPKMTEKPIIRKEEVTSQTPKVTSSNASQDTEKSDKQQGPPVGYGPKVPYNALQPGGVPAGEKDKEFYSPIPGEKRSQYKNLKILIPVVAAAIVASVLFFAFSYTATTPPETAPPETAQPESGIQGQEYSFVRAWGSKGSGDGQLNGPAGVALGSYGDVYVSDYANSRIQMFDINGSFIIKWGVNGSGNGQFSGPIDVAVGSSDNVYVADYANDRIQRFDRNGIFVTKWGSYGFNNGQFIGPNGVAVDSSDNVYVSDYANNRIQKFDSNGNFITEWGVGQFEGPGSVAVDSSDNVYVGEYAGNRIQKFDSNGNFITKWGSAGSGDGQFDGPNGVAVDSSDNVYVSDYANNRIQKFDSNGNFITTWGSAGSGDGQFNGPRGVTVDSSGNVYIADSSNDRIQVFAPKV
jgi:DNA-binding beta-propeller fold protein YncE/tetratricopeptide (TPR) repeat protein